MAQKESTFFSMLLTLVAVTAIASAGLGVVHKFTVKPIAEAKALKKTIAIERVTPEFESRSNESSRLKVPFGKDTVFIYATMVDEDTVGYAVETFTKKGFSGEFKLMVGFLPDGTIKEIAVLEHKESPGLGDKMMKAKDPWSTMFYGKHPETFDMRVTKDGGEVDAITASTITSRAYCDAVMRAYEAFQKGGEQ